MRKLPAALDVVSFMPAPRLVLFTLTAMLAFAGNSVLCRLALKQTAIDAASFTTIRLLSGALMLGLLAHVRRHGSADTGSDRQGRLGGDWPSALALFVYAGAFSFAYVSLPAGTGALILFGAVQATMILAGLRSGERLVVRQIAGLALALAGLVAIMLPGLSAPPLGGALLMLSAGIAWGVYSLRGRTAADPAQATTGNFLRAAPLSAALSLIMLTRLRLDGAGVLFAMLSGALASGVGYAVWYAALRGLTATRAASVQLSVPVIAALGGVLFLNESVTLRLTIASVAVLGGIALVVFDRKAAA